MNLGKIMEDSEDVVLDNYPDSVRKFELPKAIESMLRYIAIKNEQDFEKIKNVPQCVEDFPVFVPQDLREFTFLSITSINDEKTKLAEWFPGKAWEFLDSESKATHPVASYLSSISKTLICINRKDKKAIVVTTTTSSEWSFALASCMFAILPWRFSTSLTSKEKELFVAYKNFDTKKIANILDEAYAKTNAEQFKIKKLIYDWDNVNFDTEYNRLIQRREQIESDITTRERDLQNSYDRLKVILETIDRLVYHSDENSHKFYDFFVSHKNLSVVKKLTSYSGSPSLMFRIEDFIEYFDKEEFGKSYKNKRSALSKKTEGCEQIKKIFYLLFDKELGKIRVESVFKMQGTSSLNPVVLFNKVNTLTAIPHPHLWHHGCLGGNAPYISKYIGNGDWDLAIEQAIAATKNINFGDSVVIGEFVDDLKNVYVTDTKCIVDKDGIDMTLKEFYEKYKDEIESTTKGAKE